MLLFNTQVAAETILFPSLYLGLAESPSCTLPLSSSIRWSGKVCVKWIHTRLFQSLLRAVSAVLTGLAHTSLEKSQTTFLLRCPLFKNVLGNYLAQKLCKHVLPLSLLLSRGSPNPVFHHNSKATP